MLFKILLVDDEPHVVDAIRSILEQDSPVELEVHSAYRGKQALRLCEQFPFHLLITDIRMPDMNGLELAKAAKAANPDCEIILLTAHSDFDYACEGLRLHAEDYILKAEDNATIRERIFNVLWKLQERLNHQTWLSERTQADPLRTKLLKELLLPGPPAHQKQAASLLGLHPEKCPVLLAVCAVSPEVEFLPGLMRKSFKRCLVGRLEQLADGMTPDHCCAFIMRTASSHEHIPASWLISSMEYAQSIYAATARTECSIFFRNDIQSTEELSGRYQQALQLASQSDSVSCVRMLPDAGTQNHVTIRFIKNYVKSHISQELSLSQISEATGYNAAYLSRLFKEQTRETIIRYISRKRMEYITSLMKNPELSIQQIQEQSGFATRPYFNQFVKKETGLTPKKYRLHVNREIENPF